jgi:dienelactone hydrolase
MPDMMDLQNLTIPPAGYDADAIGLPPLEIGPTLADWERQREAIRTNWAAYLGHGPEAVPLEPQILDEEDLGDVTRALVTYQVEEGCRVTAYLMTPKDSVFCPGCVVYHPTTTMTIDQPVGLGTRKPLQFALNLARRGYVTLSPRNYIWDYCDRQATQWAEYQGMVEFLLQRWPEWTGMGKMVWDGLRAVDYLLAMAQVDASKLCCIGHSLGAKEVLYSMAFDERLKAGITCEGGVGRTFTNWDAPWYLGKQIHEHPELDHHQLLSLAAPRALLVIGGGAEPTRKPTEKGPGADTILTWNYLEAARPAYALYGAAEKLGYLLHDKGHDLPAEHEHIVYEWFAEWLNE